MSVAKKGLQELKETAVTPRPRTPGRHVAVSILGPQVASPLHPITLADTSTRDNAAFASTRTSEPDRITVLGATCIATDIYYSLFSV